MRNKIKIFLLIVFFGVFGMAGESQAEVYLRSCATSENVQTAINEASGGDTVRCTEGGVWSSGVIIPSTKGIILDGNGVTIDRNIDADAVMLEIVNNIDMMIRITNFVFTETFNVGGYFISVMGGFSNAKFRIDHCTFTANDMAKSILVTQAWGLIDNCVFTANDNAEQIHNEAYGSDNAIGWSEDITPGSGDALYIEDNNFSNSHLYLDGDSVYFWGNSAVQSYYGARTVVRHNILTMSQIDQHGSTGSIGARWWEIYDNTFNVVQYGNQSTYIALRGGSGVVFNNHEICNGWPWGCGGIQLYEEDTVNADYKVGHGKNQVSDPAFLWNNDEGIGIGGDSTPVAVVEDEDYYLSIKPSYVSYVYPHPLRRQFRSDLDVDDDVDIFDYNILLGNFGTTNDCQNIADADGDCSVNIFDYNILLGEFGAS